MIVKVLGTAAGGGVPQWNCGCTNCMRARSGEAPVRMQSSFAAGDGDTWLLVNASVDLPRQLSTTPQLWPKGDRATPFRAILLTDANVDHTAGLGELRQAPDPFVVVSSAITKELLSRERAYRRFDRPPQRWLAVEGDGSDIAALVDEDFAAQFELVAHDVPGVLPGYAGRGTHAGAVLAYSLRDRRTGGVALFAPVFAGIDDTLHDAIARADLAFLDGSFYTEDELASLGLLPKNASAMGHLPVQTTLATLTRTPRSRRRAFVHVNNSNPILDPGSPARAAVVRAGCVVANDGDVFRL